MAAFWDASAILPLTTYQQTTRTLRSMIARDPQVVVWWGTPVEVRSALARLVREAQLNEVEVAQSARRLGALRRAWREILPSERVRGVAEELPGRHGITAGDAFQLGAALVWCKERPRGRVFVCIDRRLAALAATTGFSVVS